MRGHYAGICEATQSDTMRHIARVEIWAQTLGDTPRSALRIPRSNAGNQPLALIFDPPGGHCFVNALASGMVPARKGRIQGAVRSAPARCNDLTFQRCNAQLNCQRTARKKYYPPLSCFIVFYRPSAPTPSARFAHFAFFARNNPDPLRASGLALIRSPEFLILNFAFLIGPNIFYSGDFA
jgi:hypothetical protein